MKQFIYIFIPLLIVYLTGCDKDQDDWGSGGGNNSSSEIKFDLSIGDGMKTKVTTDLDFKSTWQNNDEVGLFIVKGNGGLQASGNYVDNLKMTRQNDGTWSYTLPSGKEYYPNDGDKLSFYAYYPYNVSMNPLNYTSAVPTDQHFWPYAYDFLWAKMENISKSSTPVQLQFSHALSMIQVKVGIFDTWDVSLNMFEAITDYTINLANQSITSGSTKKNVRMWNRANTYPKGEFVTTNWALVPPQTMDVRLGWMYKNAPYTATPATNVTLAGGAVHKYYAQDIPPNRTYALGDAYPHPALAIGVVYEISNGGKNGKIVSLDENLMRWGPTNTQTNATSDSDGLANMKAVYEHNGNSFANYPVFSWVNGKNAAGITYNSGTKNIWYIPSNNELWSLHNQCRVDITTFNNQLISVGGTKIENSNWPYYWSSTQSDPENAKIIQFFGAYGNVSKGTPYRVRAIMAF